jgi:hypothetical protein
MFLLLVIQCLLNSKLNSKQQNVFALSVKNTIVKIRKRKMKCLDLNVLEKCSGNQSRCFQFLPHFSTPSGSKYLMCFKPFSLFFLQRNNISTTAPHSFPLSQSTPHSLFVFKHSLSEHTFVP